MEIVDTIIIKQRSVCNVIKLIFVCSPLQVFRFWEVSRLLKIGAIENFLPPQKRKTNKTVLHRFTI